MSEGPRSVNGSGAWASVSVVFVLGHVGIGTRMLGPLRKRLPPWPLVLGCLLPDLIDKPLYYAAHLFPGTRSIGHSGLFLLALLLAAALARRPALWAVCAGVATHLLLDVGGELIAGADPDKSIWLAIFWPAFGGRWPVANFRSILDHLFAARQQAYNVAGEAVGGAILLAAWWRKRRQSV